MKRIAFVGINVLLLLAGLSLMAWAVFGYFGDMK